MGSSSLNAEVNALERLQMVLPRNSRTSARSRGRGQCWRDVLELRALDERLVDYDLGSDVRQLAPLPGLHLLSRRLEVPLHAIYAH